METGEIVRHLRQGRRMSLREVGDALHLSRQAVSAWEQGRANVPTEYLDALAELFGVPARTMRGEAMLPDHETFRRDAVLALPSSSVNVTRRVERPEQTGARRFPVYRWGALGDPRNEDDAPLPDRTELPPQGREDLIGLNGFGVEVRGTSMIGRGIEEGDVCWVNPDGPIRLGRVVLAYIEGGDGGSGMVVKTYAHTEIGDCLLSETDGGKTPVICHHFTTIGPVVLVERNRVWAPD